MKISASYKLLLAAILLCTSLSAFSQKENVSSGEVWKKKVVRVVDMMQKDDEQKHHLTDVRQDTAILEMLIEAIKAGKLTAYSNYDADFTTKLPLHELKEMITPAVDTITVVDPVTGTETMKIVHRDFNYSNIHKYRLLEEWAFNPRTGKTEIQITGIAPLREIYDENGAYRGTLAMFWVHYNDVRGIIAKYEQYHPDNTIAGHIWADYFLSDAKPEVQR